MPLIEPQKHISLERPSRQEIEKLIANLKDPISRDEKQKVIEQIFLAKTADDKTTAEKEHALTIDEKIGYLKNKNLLGSSSGISNSLSLYAETLYTTFVTNSLDIVLSNKIPDVKEKEILEAQKKINSEFSVFFNRLQREYNNAKELEPILVHFFSTMEIQQKVFQDLAKEKITLAAKPLLQELNGLWQELNALNKIDTFNPYNQSVLPIASLKDELDSIETKFDTLINDNKIDNKTFKINPATFDPFNAELQKWRASGAAKFQRYEKQVKDYFNQIFNGKSLVDIHLARSLPRSFYEQAKAKTFSLQYFKNALEADKKAADWITPPKDLENYPDQNKKSFIATLQILKRGKAGETLEKKRKEFEAKHQENEEEVQKIEKNINDADKLIQTERANFGQVTRKYGDATALQTAIRLSLSSKAEARPDEFLKQTADQLFEEFKSNLALEIKAPTFLSNCQALANQFPFVQELQDKVEEAKKHQQQRETTLLTRVNDELTNLNQKDIFKTAVLKAKLETQEKEFTKLEDAAKDSNSFSNNVWLGQLEFQLTQAQQNQVDLKSLPPHPDVSDLLTKNQTLITNLQKMQQAALGTKVEIQPPKPKKVSITFGPKKAPQPAKAVDTSVYSVPVGMTGAPTTDKEFLLEDLTRCSDSLTNVDTLEQLNKIFEEYENNIASAFDPETELSKDPDIKEKKKEVGLKLLDAIGTAKQTDFNKVVRPIQSYINRAEKIKTTFYDDLNSARNIKDENKKKQAYKALKTNYEQDFNTLLEESQKIQQNFENFMPSYQLYFQRFEQLNFSDNKDGLNEAKQNISNTENTVRSQLKEKNDALTKARDELLKEIYPKEVERLKNEESNLGLMRDYLTDVTKDLVAQLQNVSETILTTGKVPLPPIAPLTRPLTIIRTTGNKAVTYKDVDEAIQKLTEYADEKENHANTKYKNDPDKKRQYLEYAGKIKGIVSSLKDVQQTQKNVLSSEEIKGLATLRNGLFRDIKHLQDSITDFQTTPQLDIQNGKKDFSNFVNRYQRFRQYQKEWGQYAAIIDDAIEKFSKIFSLKKLEENTGTSLEIERNQILENFKRKLNSGYSEIKNKYNVLIPVLDKYFSITELKDYWREQYKNIKQDYEKNALHYTNSLPADNTRVWNLQTSDVPKNIDDLVALQKALTQLGEIENNVKAYQGDKEIRAITDQLFLLLKEGQLSDAEVKEILDLDVGVLKEEAKKRETEVSALSIWQRNVQEKIAEKRQEANKALEAFVGEITNKNTLLIASTPPLGISLDEINAHKIYIAQKRLEQQQLAVHPQTKVFYEKVKTALDSFEKTLQGKIDQKTDAEKIEIAKREAESKEQSRIQQYKTSSLTFGKALNVIRDKAATMTEELRNIKPADSINNLQDWVAVKSKVKKYKEFDDEYGEFVEQKDAYLKKLDESYPDFREESRREQLTALNARHVKFVTDVDQYDKALDKGLEQLNIGMTFGSKKLQEEINKINVNDFLTKAPSSSEVKAEITNYEQQIAKYTKDFSEWRTEATEARKLLEDAKKELSANDVTKIERIVLGAMSDIEMRYEEALQKLTTAKDDLLTYQKSISGEEEIELEEESEIDESEESSHVSEESDWTDSEDEEEAEATEKLEEKTYNKPLPIPHKRTAEKEPEIVAKKTPPPIPEKSDFVRRNMGIFTPQATPGKMLQLYEIEGRNIAPEYFQDLNDNSAKPKLFKEDDKGNIPLFSSKDEEPLNKVNGSVRLITPYKVPFTLINVGKGEYKTKVSYKDLKKTGNFPHALYESVVAQGFMGLCQSATFDIVNAKEPVAVAIYCKFLNMMADHFNLSLTINAPSWSKNVDDEANKFIKDNKLQQQIEALDGKYPQYVDELIACHKNLGTIKSFEPHGLGSP